jgi:predicted benzoate:H+ symporter BenE
MQQQQVIAFVLSNKTIILLGAGWLFSALMSTMPPLSSNAGYVATWMYRFLQAIAANFNKHDAAKPPLP